MSGGKNSYKNTNWFTHLKSTEIIPITNFVSRFGGDLNTQRSGFGMLAVGVRFPRVLAMGGYSVNSGPSDSIEVWNDDEEKWTIAPFSLKYPNNYFAYLSLPDITMCSKEPSLQAR